MASQLVIDTIIDILISLNIDLNNLAKQLDLKEKAEVRDIAVKLIYQTDINAFELDQIFRGIYKPYKPVLHNDIFVKIASYLDIKTYLNLLQTCKIATKLLFTKPIINQVIRGDLKNVKLLNEPILNKIKAIDVDLYFLIDSENIKQLGELLKRAQTLIRLKKLLHKFITKCKLLTL